MRLPPISEPTQDQASLHARITDRRGGVHGPFAVLLHSPHTGDKLEELATTCMRDSQLVPRLRELTLLVVARRLDAQHSWNAHIDKAVAAGVDREALDRLARGEQPRFPRPDEDVLHQFVTQILVEHFADDETYAAALAELGESCLVELVIALGTFATLAMLLNVFEVDLPPGSDPPFPDVRDFQRVLRPDHADSPKAEPPL